MAKHTLKILRCEHRRIFKVYWLFYKSMHERVREFKSFAKEEQPVMSMSTDAYRTTKEGVMTLLLVVFQFKLENLSTSGIRINHFKTKILHKGVIRDMKPKIMFLCNNLLSRDNYFSSKNEFFFLRKQLEPVYIKVN